MRKPGFPLPLLAVLLLTLPTAACMSGSTPTPINPTRGPLPTLQAVPWRPVDTVITRESAAQLQHTGSLLAHDATVNRLVFSQSGRWLISIDAVGVAVLWNMMTGRQGMMLSAINQNGDGDIAFAFLSADESTVLAITARHTVKYLTIAEGTWTAETPANLGVVSWADAAPNGRFVATGGAQGDVLLWDITARKIVQSLKIEGAGSFRAIKFSPDGNLLAAITADERGPLVRVWDVAASKALADLRGFQSSPRSLAFSANSALLAVGGRQEAQLFSVSSSGASGVERRYSLMGENLFADRGMAFSPDGQFFAAIGRGEYAYVWSVADGLPVGSLPKHGDGVSSLVFSPDSQLLLTTSFSPRTGAFLWPTEALRPGVTDFPRGTIGIESNGFLTCAWSPDGKRIVLADASGGLIVYGIPRAQ